MGRRRGLRLRSNFHSIIYISTCKERTHITATPSPSRFPPPSSHSPAYTPNARRPHPHTP